MIAKTRTLHRLVFIPCQAYSIVSAAVFYWPLGDTAFMSIVLSAVGIAFEVFSTLMLVTWMNAKHMNRRLKWNAKATMWLVFTVTASISTYFVTLQSIESKISHQSAATVDTYNARARLAECEKQLADTGAEQRVKAITAQMANVTHAIAERTAAMNREIERINADEATRRGRLQEEADALRKQIAAQTGIVAKVQDVFTIVERTVSIPEYRIKGILSIFITVGIAIIMYHTSWHTFQRDVKRTAKRKETDQVMMWTA